MTRYLAIGHISKDIVPGGWTFGGAVTYASRAARALGCVAQVITSTETDLDVRPALLDIEVFNTPSSQTTTFENIYTAAGRRQILHALASTLTPDRLALNFQADIVHLAPIAQEVDPGWLDRFDDGLIGVTPQGWLRQWDAQGHVSPIEWTQAANVLPKAHAAIVSIEDIGHDEDRVRAWADLARLLVVTRGARGCTVFVSGKPTDIPSPRRPQVLDTTGAGDIFAASFFVYLQQMGDPIRAARFANCIAARSITRHGLDSVPTPAEIEQCLASTL